MHPVRAPRIAGRLVTLRPFLDSDISPSYLGWLNDPTTMRWSNQRFRHHTYESCRAYRGGFEDTPNLFLAIEARSDGAVLGTMTAYVAEQHGTADMGILVGEREAWGKGVGLEAWTLLMEWLLHTRGLRKVTGGTLDANVGMVRIMERSGMQLEGRRLRQELVDGVAHDVLYFGRFRDGC